MPPGRRGERPFGTGVLEAVCQRDGFDPEKLTPEEIDRVLSLPTMIERTLARCSYLICVNLGASEELKEEDFLLRLPDA